MLEFGSDHRGEGGRKILRDSVQVGELLKRRGCKMDDTVCEEMVLSIVTTAAAVTAAIVYEETMSVRVCNEHIRN